MDFKGDHNFSRTIASLADTATAEATEFRRISSASGNPAYTFNNGPNGTRTHSVVTDFTRAQSPTTIWTVRYGLIYSDFTAIRGRDFDLTTLGLPSYMKENATHAVFPTIAPENYIDIGTEGWVVMDRQEGVHQFSGSYFEVDQRSQLKFGGETQSTSSITRSPVIPRADSRSARRVS